jgi:hypothetical protein
MSIKDDVDPAAVAAPAEEALAVTAKRPSMQ